MHALVDLAVSAHAATSARAANALVGPYRSATPLAHLYRLSETGGDLWMAVVRECNATSPPTCWMLRDVLFQWDIDDPDEVTRLATTFGHDGTSHWQRAVAGSVLWRPAAQQALAQWLTSGPLRTGDTEAALMLVGRLLAYREVIPVIDELVDATFEAQRRAPTAMRSVDRFNESWFRTGVAEVVVACATEALRSDAAESRLRRDRCCSRSGRYRSSARGSG